MPTNSVQVVLIAVISLDGRIARPGQSGAGFASAADQIWFRRSLLEFDCSVMGRRTFGTIREQVIGRADTKRLRVVMTRDVATHRQDAIPNALEFSSDEPGSILGDLARRGRKKCALLGGGEVYRLFVQAGLVDALWLTLEPVVIGAGTPLIDGATPETHFRLAETRHLSKDTLLLNYTGHGATPAPLPPA